MSFRGSSPPTCGQFPASFLAFIDQTIDSPDAFVVADPEYTFFKEVLGFRDDDIQHTIGDAIKFFNESYGLDFSLSPPNDQNEYFYQNAKLSSGRFAADVIYWVTGFKQEALAQQTTGCVTEDSKSHSQVTSSYMAVTVELMVFQLEEMQM